MTSTGIAVIMALAMIAGGTVGGVAYHDGIFTAVPLTEISRDMVNQTITVKGNVLFDGDEFSWLKSMKKIDSIDLEDVFEDATWCIINDIEDGTAAYAVIRCPRNLSVSEEEAMVFTGKLVGYGELSGVAVKYLSEQVFNQNISTIKIAYITSADYHRAWIFK